MHPFPQPKPQCLCGTINPLMKKEGKQKIIYQASSGALELRGDFEHETVWATRMQMAGIFGVNPQAISKHIHNIYKEKELPTRATRSKIELVQNEAGRTVKRNVQKMHIAKFD